MLLKKFRKRSSLWRKMSRFKVNGKMVLFHEVSDVFVYNYFWGKNGVFYVTLTPRLHNENPFIICVDDIIELESGRCFMVKEIIGVARTSEMFSTTFSCVEIDKLGASKIIENNNSYNRRNFVCGVFNGKRE